MVEAKEKIVFDANFFICAISIRAKNFLKNLDHAGKKLGLDYYISEKVFNEIKAPYTFKDRFKAFINVEKILQSEIQMIKDELNKSNIKFPAQDPDLSLIALSERLMDDDSTIHIVTDDFKLAKNTASILKNKVNILSLSSFLLKINRTIPDKHMRNYFKTLWRKSLNYTLHYMIERAHVYPAEQKIQWLIEKAINVTQDSILTQDVHFLDKREEQMKFEIGISKYPQEIAIAEKFIENQKLSQSKEEKIHEIQNFLENLKISREYLKRARECIVKNESNKAAKLLKKGNGFLISLLQLAAGELTKLRSYEIVEALICSEISKMEFLRAFILVSLGRVNSAIDSLERAALFSTIIHNHQTCLTLNYVKALILLFHGLYDNAIMSYNFTE
jgi:predicted nucleic acid-binding protein